jgi:hypothetical protein
MSCGFWGKFFFMFIIIILWSGSEGVLGDFLNCIFQIVLKISIERA